MNYKEELTKAMTLLGQNEKTLFLGQSCEFEGTGMFGTLSGVPMEKRQEFQVAEDFQAGYANGLALLGYIPVSIFPRWNFLLLAINQIINHLDKIPLISDFRPKVIIRTGIGSKFPLNPQAQHFGDFTEAIKLMTKTIEVIRLDIPEHIVPSYERALSREDGRSTILVEWSDAYNPDFKIKDYNK